jgi:hypothetical protein
MPPKKATPKPQRSRENLAEERRSRSQSLPSIWCSLLIFTEIQTRKAVSREVSADPPSSTLMPQSSSTSEQPATIAHMPILGLNQRDSGPPMVSPDIRPEEDEDSILSDSLPRLEIQPDMAEIWAYVRALENRLRALEIKEEDNQGKNKTPGDDRILAGQSKRGIIEAAMDEYGYKEQVIRGLYARGKIALGGFKATVKLMEFENSCARCVAKKLDCTVMTEDTFGLYVRGTKQCGACIQAGDQCQFPSK